MQVAPVIVSVQIVTRVTLRMLDRALVTSVQLEDMLMGLVFVTVVMQVNTAREALRRVSIALWVHILTRVLAPVLSARQAGINLRLGK